MIMHFPPASELSGELGSNLQMSGNYPGFILEKRRLITLSRAGAKAFPGVKGIVSLRAREFYGQNNAFYLSSPAKGMEAIEEEDIGIILYNELWGGSNIINGAKGWEPQPISKIMAVIYQGLPEINALVSIEKKDRESQPKEKTDLEVEEKTCERMSSAALLDMIAPGLKDIICEKKRNILVSVGNSIIISSFSRKTLMEYMDDLR